MAVTTSNMSLKRWNLSGDGFSYTELSDNFNLIDAHDHTTGKGVQVPTAGIANSAVTLAKLATNSIDATKILDASVTDTELASPNNAVWRPVFQHSAQIPAATSGTLYASLAGWASNLSSAVELFPWSLTAVDVAGKTARWRTRTVVATNGTAPGQTFTVGVVPITASGGASNALTLTAGAAIATSVVTTPAANSIVAVTGSTISAPATGPYLVSVGLSGAVAANALLNLATVVEVSHT
jgi:hypothetical protein